MARDAEKPASSDKGKGKASEQVNGTKNDENGQNKTNGVDSKDVTKIDLPEGKMLGDNQSNPSTASFTDS